MSLKKLKLITTPDHEGQRLDDVLVTWLPQALKEPISKGKVRKLVMAGAVYLNGKRVRIASKPIRARAEIQVYLDLKKLNTDSKSSDLPFKMTQDRVLYEDDYLILVNKPAGLPTQPTLDESRNNLFASVKKFLAERKQVSVNEVYLGLHHRLDRDTSGVLLLTLSQVANPGVADLFKSHRVSKVYQALTHPKSDGSVPSQWQVKNYLGPLKDSPKKNRFGSVRSGGDFAHTEFQVLEEFKSQGRDQALLVEARPLTGRTHQIRVHLSEDGMPILGDRTYGGAVSVGQLQIPRVMLHAASLTFDHPVNQNKITVECPLPEDFNRCLQSLRRGDRNS